MTKIAAYKFKPSKPRAGVDLFDPKANKLTPLESLDSLKISIHEVLAAFTLSAEAGILEEDGWAQQLFANRRAYREFIAALSEMDDNEDGRIDDRTYQALETVGQFEEEFVRSSEMAEALNRQAYISGQLDKFDAPAKKAPAKRRRSSATRHHSLIPRSPVSAGLPPCQNI
jgi:hypothetical protein